MGIVANYEQSMNSVASSFSETIRSRNDTESNRRIVASSTQSIITITILQQESLLVRLNQ
jgi:hypothetical protein